MNIDKVKELIDRGLYTDAAQMLTMCENKEVVTDDSMVHCALTPWKYVMQECFIVVCLDGAQHIIDVKAVSHGIANKVLVHPREVFRPAIIANAVSIIIAHNHPSGDMEFSKEDLEITVDLQKAGELLGIEVLDHILISRNGFKSLLDECDADHREVEE